MAERGLHASRVLELALGDRKTNTRRNGGYFFCLTGGNCSRAPRRPDAVRPSAVTAGIHMA